MYVKEIKQIKPLEESPYVYSKKRWSDLVLPNEILFEDFERPAIYRKNIIDAYKTYYTGNGDVIYAFVLTMVWGFADNGYGAYRTNSYINEKSKLDCIKNAVDLVGKTEYKKAFDELNEIKGLGVSYISKVLYFASKALNHQSFNLIFDIRVANGLVMLTTPKEIYEILDIYPSNKYVDYEKYNKLIHNLSEKHGLEADALELFLFRKDFNKKYNR